MAGQSKYGRALVHKTPDKPAKLHTLRREEDGRMFVWTMDGMRYATKRKVYIVRSEKVGNKTVYYCY